MPASSCIAEIVQSVITSYSIHYTKLYEKLIVFWWLGAGLCGWVSLFFLYRSSERHLSQIPKALLGGVGAGVVAALSFPPIPNKYAYAPVILALLLLHIARTNPRLTEATSKQSSDKG